MVKEEAKPELNLIKATVSRVTQTIKKVRSQGQRLLTSPMQKLFSRVKIAVLQFTPRKKQKTIVDRRTRKWSWGIS